MELPEGLKPWVMVVTPFCPNSVRTTTTNIKMGGLACITDPWPPLGGPVVKHIYLLWSEAIRFRWIWAKYEKD